MAEQFRRASFAEVYEADLVATVFGPWADRLLEHVPVHPGDRVLDVCCGTGAVARRAAAVAGAGRVIGIDASHEMLEVARRVDVGGLIEWRQADADALPLPDDEFDVALCQHGLQFVSDRAGALSELARVVRPGGRLGVAVWRPLAENPVVNAMTTADRALGWPTGMAETGFSLGDPEELAALVRASGWDDVTVVVDELRREVPSVQTLIDRRTRSAAASDDWASATKAERARWAAIVDELLEPFRKGDDGFAPSRANLLSASH